MHVAIDPGSKNFAIVFFNNHWPVFMSYHPVVCDFNVNSPLTVREFYQTTQAFLNFSKRLIIERYVVRKATKNASSEKINLMIGITLAIASNMPNEPLAVMSSTWKRKLNYRSMLSYWKELGCLMKDKHFMDCLLMYAVEYKLNPRKMLLAGTMSYKLLKLEEKKQCTEQTAKERDMLILKSKSLKFPLA